MSFIGDMFGGGSKAPAAPNPSVLAGQQQAANEATARTTARLNRLNTFTPTGSVIYTDKGGDRWEVEQTLSPDAQGLLDQSMQIGSGVNTAAQARLDNLDNAPFSLDGVPDFQSSIDYSGLMEAPQETDLNAFASRAEDAAYSRVMDRLNPEFNRARDDLETRLANQGITMGSDAYGTEMERFSNQVNDARTRAAYDAIGEGSALRSSLLTDALTGRQQGISERFADLNLANQARGQEISDRLMERTQGLNELAALLQGQQAISMPQTMPTAQVGVAAPDVMGANAMAQNARNLRYQSGQNASNAALGGLFGLGGAALSNPDLF